MRTHSIAAPLAYASLAYASLAHALARCPGWTGASTSADAIAYPHHADPHHADPHHAYPHHDFALSANASRPHLVFEEQSAASRSRASNAPQSDTTSSAGGTAQAQRSAGFATTVTGT